MSKDLASDLNSIVSAVFQVVVAVLLLEKISVLKNRLRIRCDRRDTVIDKLCINTSSSVHIVMSGRSDGVLHYH